MLVDDLTVIDYQILKFVSRKQPVGISEIKEGLPKIDSIEYRIAMLSTPEYRLSADIRIPCENSYFLEELYDEDDIYHGLQIYRLTALGEKVLQDYKLKTKCDKKAMWLENAWIPIIVAFATTVLTNYILPKLPKLLGWFSSIF